jgi:hypothetical protein
MPEPPVFLVARRCPDCTSLCAVDLDDGTTVCDDCETTLPVPLSTSQQHALTDYDALVAYAESLEAAITGAVETLHLLVERSAGRKRWHEPVLQVMAVLRDVQDGKSDEASADA